MAINNTIYPSQIHLAWRADWQWIGLKKTEYYTGTGYWFWIGKETTLLSNSSPLWEDGHPWVFGGRDCGCVNITYSNRLLDRICTYSHMSLCERDAE